MIYTKATSCRESRPRVTKPIEIERLPWKHSVDPMGFIFLAEGKLFRAVYPHARDHVRGLFECGLVDELQEMDLIPRTAISDRHIKGVSDLVLEHELIAPLTYPNEWCFEMLRQAAITTLDVNIVARKYGYQTTDAHCYNVVFDNVTPKYVDLTSLIPIHNSPRRPGWKPFGEFMQCFYYPLSLWSEGAEKEARRSLIDGGISPLSWRLFQSRLRWRRAANLTRLFYKAYFALKAVNTMPEELIRQRLCQSPRRRRFATFLIQRIRRHSLPFSSVSLTALKKKVEKIAEPHVNSFWMNYHRDTVLDGRFQRLINLLKTHEVRAITDVGGNAGFFSRAAVEHGEVEKAICIDYDANAINALYKRLVEDRISGVHPVVAAFRENQTSSLFRADSERFISDAVVALAITHHLHITQGMSLDYIFSRLLSFARRLIFVEHMPLGHYSSRFEGHPEPPASYSPGEFRKALGRQCNIVHEEHLAKNRTLFIGRKRR